jgi:thiol-disulfide isomerase/thioredoxin
MPSSFRLRRAVCLAAALALAAGCSDTRDETAEANRAPTATPEVVASRTRQLVSLADGLAAQKRFPEAMVYLGDVLKIDPDNRDGLFRAAQFSLVGGRMKEERESERELSDVFYTRALHFARQLKEKYPELKPEERDVLAMSHYAQARILARRGKPDEAMTELQTALEEGFQDVDSLTTDPELDTLRQREDFQKLAAPFEAKALQRAGERARTLLAETQPSDFDFELPGLDGKPVKLADLRGDKVTIVDLWGTWCGPCKVEIPHLIELRRKYQEKGLEIVGVNFEQTDDPKRAVALIQAFIEEQKLPYPCVLGDEKTMSQVQPFEGFPTTLFLDATGKVRAKLVGLQALRDLEAVVTALLEEPTPKAGSD